MNDYNKYILILKNNSFDEELLKEFLSGILSEFDISLDNNCYLIKHKYAKDKLLKEALNSYVFDVSLKTKVFFGDFKKDEELKKELSIVLKYFNFSLVDIFYDLKKLLREVMIKDVSCYKEVVFKSYINDYDMQKTLKVYIENNMNVLKSSKLLYVHRNTLLNKLSRFKEETGFDPKDFKDAYLLYTLLK